MTGFWDGSCISWAICKQSAPRSRQITTPTPHHSIFTGRLLFLTPNQQRQSTEGTRSNNAMLIKATLLLVHFLIMSKFYVFVLCVRVCIV